MTPAQLRAARALLGWSREDLAKKAGVSDETIKGF
jgi:DNA-binding XRE family transcriptional regulator